MIKSHPDVLARTVKGRGIYGARQIMDITHPVYRFYGERVIRELMKRTAQRKCVIGFQLDNYLILETEAQGFCFCPFLDLEKGAKFRLLIG